MQTDAWFTRGRGHRVCQDYARAGADWVALSDGCSSSPDTDCGARLLVLAAAQSPEIDQVLALAARTAEGLLPAEALDATLLTLRVQASGLIEARAWGDGVFFGRRRDGTLEAWEIDHGGLPAYPAYRLHPGRQARHRREAPAARVRHHRAGDLSESIETTEFSLRFDPQLWQMIGIASDGLLAFGGPNGRVPLLEVLAQVTDVRVPRGRFVERSSIFFLRRSCPKLGWVPTDDYSVAAMWLEALT